MEHAKVNGVELEYEVVGSGEPVLLISPVLADGFLPLVAEPSLNERYQLIRYHKRGWVGSTHPSTPVSVADHAADATALLDHLGIARAHVVGHSSGAAVAAQLALDEPDRVATLALLELSIFSVPSGAGVPRGGSPGTRGVRQRRPRSGAGDVPQRRQRTRLGGMPSPARRACPRRRAPGDQGRRHVLRRRAPRPHPVGLQRRTGRSDPPTRALRAGQQHRTLWVEVAEFLRTTMPDVEERTIDGVGHLLHIQQPEPVAQQITEFLQRHPITA